MDDRIKEQFTTEMSLDQVIGHDHAVVSSPDRDAFLNKRSNMNSRTLVVLEKPYIHFPSKKLKAEVPAMVQIVILKQVTHCPKLFPTPRN